MSAPAVHDLEARARWHLDIGYEPYDPGAADPTLDVDYDFDQGDELCFECGLGPYECRCHEGDDCGRWRNGNLSRHCTKAGSEECDFECPYRNTLRF